MSESLRPQFGLLRFGCALALAGAALLVSGVRAEAQEAQMTAGVNVEKQPVDVANLIANPRLANQLRSVVMPIMQVGKADGPQQLSNFDLYNVFRVAELTLPPTDAKDTVERRRQKFKVNDILKVTGNLSIPQDLHKRANQLMMANLVPLIGNSQYSMDARYNAMLLLGMLDEVEPESAAARAAVPLIEAEPTLLQAAKTSTLPEILRIGALLGLARHCDLMPSNGANRAAIAAEALTLLSAKSPPEGFSANGFHWARKQAISMVIGLAKTGNETSQPPFVQALLALLADESQPLFLRRDAALAFGHVDPAAIAGGAVKPVDICKAMANLTSTVMNAGTPRFDPTAPIDLSKPEDVFQEPNEDNKVRFAEGVAYYLNCIATGLGGRSTNRGLLKGVGPTDPAFPLVNALLNTHVNPLVTALSKPNPDSNRINSDIVKHRDLMKPWLEQNALVAAPAGAGANAAPAGNGAPVGAGAALGAP